MMMKYFESIQRNEPLARNIASALISLFSLFSFFASEGFLCGVYMRNGMG